MQKITNRFFPVYGFIAGLVIIFISSLPTWGQNTSVNTNNIPIGGTNNVGIGFGALNVNVGGSNTAIGYQSLLSNTTGSFNTANGHTSLFSNTTGGTNTANGWRTLYYNITGQSNTASGAGALSFNTSGSFNTAIGNAALTYNTSGDFNTANGDRSLFNNSNGLNNTASGRETLYTNISGNDNTAFGESAGRSSLGSGNIYIGRRAGALETGSNKLYIGNNDNRAILYGDISTGQVLLGKPDATGYSFKGSRTLNVLGGILADSVRVALSGNWADYVFTEDYQLLAPDALKAFIKTHKHLPGIPTQQQVEKDGIHLAEMNIKLLEKIEELTLYMLKQQDELTHTRTAFQETQKEINALKEITTKQMALIIALEKKMAQIP
jgi:hypothetical protein